MPVLARARPGGWSPVTMAPTVAQLLEDEAQAIVLRLSTLQPFSVSETMVPAATVDPGALVAMERYLDRTRADLRARVERFLRWLAGEGRNATPEAMQRRFVLLRLRFNVVITHYDLFADVITQRSERENGLWIAGLDVAARDGLRLPGLGIRVPPVACYLDRGAGAAIRRARTRLPGGGENPVSVVRVPRERMVGHGIGSSLYHEVGHQVAALLNLVASVGAELDGLIAASDVRYRPAWKLVRRWISEILADFWSVGQLGIASTLGLIGVVSLPTRFVVKVNTDDPHPSPFLRVRISAAIGDALYPHPQWLELDRTWAEMYPPSAVQAEARGLFATIEALIPHLVTLIINHRPGALRGRPLHSLVPRRKRHPEMLLADWRRYSGDLSQLGRARPTHVFAVLGQARAASQITPEEETQMLGRLLRGWALRDSLAAARHAVTCQRRSSPLRGSHLTKEYAP